MKSDAGLLAISSAGGFWSVYFRDRGFRPFAAADVFQGCPSDEPQLYKAALALVLCQMRAHLITVLI